MLVGRRRPTSPACNPVMAITREKNPQKLGSFSHPFPQLQPHAVHNKTPPFVIFLLKLAKKFLWKRDDDPEAVHIDAHIPDCYGKDKRHIPYIMVNALSITPSTAC